MWHFTFAFCGNSLWFFALRPPFWRSCIIRMRIILDTKAPACQFKTRKIPTPFRSTESMWRFLYIRHQTSAFSHQQSSFLLFPSSPLGETERGSLLLILILPPILFRHFQKFSKLLYPLRFHLPSIQCFTIRFQPIQVVMFFQAMFRRITMISLNKGFYLIISCQPTSLLIHLPSYISHLTSSAHHSPEATYTPL